MSVDPLVALCGVTASRKKLNTNDVIALVQPVLGDPLLRDIATLFLTDIGIKSMKESSVVPDSTMETDSVAKIAAKIDVIADEIKSRYQQFDDLSIKYHEFRERLARTNSLSIRRELIGVLEGTARSIQPPDSDDETVVSGLLKISAQTRGKILELEKEKNGNYIQGYFEGNPDDNHKGTSKENILQRYYDLITQLHHTLQLQKSAQEDLQYLLDSHFPERSDSHFVRNNILQQLECALARAEMNVITKRVAIVEPIVADLKLKLKKIENADSEKFDSYDSSSHRKNIVSIARRNMKLHQKLNELSAKVYGSSSQSACAYNEASIQRSVLTSKLCALVSSWTALHSVVLKNTTKGDVNRSHGDFYLAVAKVGFSSEQITETSDKKGTDEPGVVPQEKKSRGRKTDAEETLKQQLLEKIRAEMADQLYKK